MRTVGWHYAEAHQRLDGLLRPLDDEAWEASVPTCPGWRVRDVLAHLVGNIEDVSAGRLPGLPTAEQTAAQVDRHRADDPVQLLDGWATMAPFVAEAVSDPPRWPAAIDVVTHEHDVRLALGTPGARDHESVRTFAAMVGEVVETDTPVAFDLGDRVVVAGSDTRSARPDRLTLRTTPFELLRLGLGRRSRAQVAALDWSADPEPVLDALFVFGPSPVDIDE